MEKLIIFADVNPDQYRKEHGKAPPGYQFDPKKKKCVVIDKPRAAEWQRNQKAKEQMQKKALDNMKKRNKGAIKKEKPTTKKAAPKLKASSIKKVTKSFAKTKSGRKLLAGKKIPGKQFKADVKSEVDKAGRGRKIFGLCALGAGVIAATGALVLKKNPKLLENGLESCKKIKGVLDTALDKIKNSDKVKNGAEIAKNLSNNFNERINKVSSKISNSEVKKKFDSLKVNLSEKGKKLKRDAYNKYLDYNPNYQRKRRENARDEWLRENGMRRETPPSPKTPLEKLRRKIVDYNPIYQKRLGDKYVDRLNKFRQRKYK